MPRALSPRFLLTWATPLEPRLDFRAFTGGEGHSTGLAAVKKELWNWRQSEDWVWLLLLPLGSCVTLKKLLNFSGLPILHLWNRTYKQEAKKRKELSPQTGTEMHLNPNSGACPDCDPGNPLTYQSPICQVLWMGDPTCLWESFEKLKEKMYVSCLACVWAPKKCFFLFVCFYYKTNVNHAKYLAA